MPQLKIEGLADLQKGLAKKIQLDDVKRVVKQNGGELQEKMMRNADFKKGYQTGTTKRSITLTVKDSELTSEVEPTTEYSPYPEYGTRFMEAQPYVRPAFNEQKEQFKSDLDKLVK
jgi:HK97 gp10 family phage protein